MANYNLAQGGDIHYNANMALYPQNAFVEGRPEFGSSTTLLKPAHHWEGGHYAPVRHMNFNNDCSECALAKIANQIVAGDTFLTHIIPGMSLLTDFHYVIHKPEPGVAFQVRLAHPLTGSDTDDTGDDTYTVLGTINAGVAGDGWFQVANGGVYIPSDTNDAIEFVVTTWVTPEAPTQEVDPCGVFGECPSGVNLCLTSTAFYRHARAEKWCEDTCYDSCGCS